MQDKREWWQTFFSGLSADVQRLGLTEAEAAEYVDFVEVVLKPRPGARLLDVPCGLALHSLELAARGYRVTGVDITSSYIDEARRLAAEKHLNLELRQSDMRELPWRQEFEGAISIRGSFGYFDDEGNRAFVSAVGRTLKPGARWLLDAHVAESLLPKYQPRDWTQVEDILLLQERQYDLEQSRIDATWLAIRGNRQERFSSSVRIYTFRELGSLLADEGFRDLQAYGSHHLDPFQVGSPLLYLTARKSG